MGKGWCLTHDLAGRDSDVGEEEEGSEEEDDEFGLDRDREEVVMVSIVPGEGWDRGVATDQDSDGEEEPLARGRKLPRNI